MARYTIRSLAISTVVAFAYRYYLYERNTRLYGGYYKTFDADKVYQELKAKRAYKCFDENGKIRDF